MSIQLSPEYAYVLLTSLAINLQCTLTGSQIGGLRRKLGVKYPDMGSGRYAAKLNDKDWENFNNYQRVHYNYIETATQTNVLLLAAGLFQPLVAAGFGVAYIIGRSIYSTMYVNGGADKRMYGALIFHVSEIAWLGMTIYGCLKALNVF
ncbi:hypothetical protein HK098_006007 [Nowakowskiella sp. JEL0407]|nr:hypothetical protein HK098_006007 [Nowakowskiella sp. JEL0407]